MDKINIGLCGFGTVGKGVYDILKKNKEEIYKKSGILFNIHTIFVRNPDKYKKYSGKLYFTNNINEIIENKEIDIVVELIGGYDTAKKIVIESLKRKKSVITANKAILAADANKILKVAEENNSDIFFEASVAGSIPIIKILKESVISNKIKNIYGILNGTANYILSKMSDENREFADILKEAIQKGYAEADPTLDIEGLDAAHKLSILMSISFNTFFNYHQIYTEGISEISLQDIQFANELGYVIKLLAIAKEINEKVEGRVHPTLIKKGTLLSTVKEANNAVFIEGDFTQKQFYFGKGAGRYPTASVVVSDIIEAGLNIINNCKKRRPFYSVFTKDFENKELIPIEEITCKYYLRFNVIDRPGVLSKISGVLGENNISIEAVIQKGRDIYNKGSVPIVMITHESLEKNIKNALKIIDNLDIVKQKTILLRIENNL